MYSSALLCSAIIGDWGRYILRGCENTLYEGLGIVENLVVRDISIIELSDDSLMYHMLPYDLARSSLIPTSGMSVSELCLEQIFDT